jgi:hypothetical protein
MFFVSTTDKQETTPLALNSIIPTDTKKMGKMQNARKLDYDVTFDCKAVFYLVGQLVILTYFRCCTYPVSCGERWKQLNWSIET